jgi:hypothetical protein
VSLPIYTIFHSAIATPLNAVELSSSANDQQKIQEQEQHCILQFAHLLQQMRNNEFCIANI